MEEISDDLVVGTADSLSLIRPVDEDEVEDASGGISLHEIGAVIQTRMTTQKIRIQGVFEDEEETLVELPKDDPPTVGPDEESVTQEIPPEDLEKLEHPTIKPGDDEKTRR